MGVGSTMGLVMLLGESVEQREGWEEGGPVGQGD